MTIVGHTDTINFLNRLLQERRVPHLLVFSGKSGIGKKTFAIEFAKNWIGSKSEIIPDLHVYSPEGKLGLHTIQSVKEMIEKLSYLPYNGGGVSIIIDDAERMLAASANALLKTIEEPPANTLIILITSSIDELIPTIRSRCQLIRFQPLKEEEVSYILQTKYQIDEKSSTSISKMARGSISRALEQLNLFSETEKFKKILNSNNISQILEFSITIQKILEDRKKSFEESQTEESEVQTKWLQEVDYFFEDLYYLMRDMILEGGGDPVTSLVKVEKALSFSKLQLKRSTPLLQTIENLMLHFHEALQK